MEDELTCRVCRSGEEAGKLYRPCKCKGSIERIHESCLKSWLSISKGTRCELCKHTFRWEKVYAAEAPPTLPKTLVVRHALLLFLRFFRLILRFLLVGFIWIGLLPWLILWTWRWFFFVAKSWGIGWESALQDADWSRLNVAFLLLRLQYPPPPSLVTPSATSAAEAATSTPSLSSIVEAHTTTNISEIASAVVSAAVSAVSGASRGSGNVSASKEIGQLSGNASSQLSNLFNVTGLTDNITATIANASSQPPLSPWNLLKAILSANGTTSLTPSNLTLQDGMHRAPSHVNAGNTSISFIHYLEQAYEDNRETLDALARDCFSGQIIVCCVVVAFVGGFLLREWVVANQPIPPPAMPALPLPLPPPTALPTQEAPPVQPEPAAAELNGPINADTTADTTGVQDRAHSSTQEADRRARLYELNKMLPSYEVVNHGRAPVPSFDASETESSRSSAEPVSSEDDSEAIPMSPLPHGETSLSSLDAVPDGAAESTRDHSNHPKVLEPGSKSEAVDEQEAQETAPKSEAVEEQEGLRRRRIGPEALRELFASENSGPSANGSALTATLPAGPGPSAGAQAYLDRQREILATLLEQHRQLDETAARGSDAEPAKLLLGLTSPHVAQDDQPRDSENRSDTLPPPVVLPDGDEDEWQTDSASFVTMSTADSSSSSSASEESESSNSDGETDEDGAEDAAEAGLEPEDVAAIEAAEFEDDLLLEADFEGIMDAIGLQGPLLALFQNVAMMVLIISMLLLVVVWLPLMVGRTVVAAQAWRLALVPVNTVRVATDPLADALVGLLRKFSSTRLQARDDTAARRTSTLSGVLQRLSATTHLTTSERSSQIPANNRWTGSIQGAVGIRIQNIVGQWQILLLAARQRWQTMGSQDTDLDRICCVALGYAIILSGIMLYLRFTRYAHAQSAARAVRDTLHHYMTLLKAGLFFLVEIVVFPSICGLLLNLSTIPMFPGVTVASRIQYYRYAPLTSFFFTWLFGTNFMALFAETVSVLRKCLRKGVLWFIRDPTDPDTNPLREILESSSLHQAKKISRSLLVYAIVVVTCFGSFPWLLRLLDIGLFPLRWNSTRAISVVPVDLLFMLFVAPRTLGSSKPSRFVRKMMSEWCTLTAHQLRLSSFMLGVRINDEEGSHVRRSWRAWLLLKKAPIVNDEVACATSREVVFRRDGGFARVVAADNIKIVSAKMFVRTSEDGTPLDGQGAQAVRDQIAKGLNDESKFTVAYIPPHFRTRLFLFVYLFWVTGSCALFVSFAVPILVGRLVLDAISAEPLHDVYSMIVGLHVVMGTAYAYRQICRRWRHHQRHRRRRAALQRIGAVRPPMQPRLQITAAARSVLTAIRVLLLALQAGVLLPTVTGSVFEIYVLLPFRDNTAQMASISLSLAWAYGLVLCSLAVSTSRYWRPNRVTQIMNDVAVNGIVAAAPKLNLLILRIESRMMMALALPGLISSLYRTAIQQYKSILPAQIHERLPTLALQAEDSSDVLIPLGAFKAAVFSISCSLTGVLLSGPIRRLSTAWAAYVWESEFVVQRKLRNIDDPPVENEDSLISVPPH